MSTKAPKFPPQHSVIHFDLVGAVSSGAELYSILRRRSVLPLIFSRKATAYERFFGSRSTSVSLTSVRASCVVLMCLNLTCGETGVRQLWFERRERKDGGAYHAVVCGLQVDVDLELKLSRVVFLFDVNRVVINFCADEGPEFERVKFDEFFGDECAARGVVCIIDVEVYDKSVARFDDHEVAAADCNIEGGR